MDVVKLCSDSLLNAEAADMGLVKVDPGPLLREYLLLLEYEPLSLSTTVSASPDL